MPDRAEIIEVSGKHFVYRATLRKGTKTRYTILRGKYIDGKFVEYKNLFVTTNEVRTFKTEKEAKTYLSSLAAENKKEGA